MYPLTLVRFNMTCAGTTPSLRVFHQLAWLNFHECHCSPRGVSPCNCILIITTLQLKKLCSDVASSFTVVMHDGYFLAGRVVGERNAIRALTDYITKSFVFPIMSTWAHWGIPFHLLIFFRKEWWPIDGSKEWRVALSDCMFVTLSISSILYCLNGRTSPTRIITLIHCNFHFANCYVVNIHTLEMALSISLKM